MDRDKVVQAINERAMKGRIPCVTCLQIAEENNIPQRELGLLLDELGIKVVQCQLGLFKEDKTH
jgi:hypothetical protein